MTEQNDLLTQVTKQFNTQKLRLEQMQNILDEELEAVKNRDGNLILEISKKKELHLEAITNADKLLNNEKYVEIINTTPEFFSTLKNEINDLLLKCKHTNEVIYLTATQNQITLSKVKQLLIGGSKNPTYNAYGQKNTNSSIGPSLKA
ncbi:hypothetical protein GCM10008107_01740 [Psychrosphaera saromensis]|uniref:Flagellar biosynthesis protein FlgN n=1 Tax=Psychrosphaera saromensis TaxID=716813 RepID=A0A2S7V015_9GAMM|nr:flagellar export chaperone FlgN [Psychrosphaera saromensis]PQJ54861.1 hypothetical protein BTO11_15175 [Psychrosphaera saromensis]GHB56555.1 hypothetical protein GCM10008107_01740 [Psychrosphaera saromensis]GLQ13896.1 hypothetical protein GCM10007917_13510 [Psychrosphaera saromensis]